MARIPYRLTTKGIQDIALSLLDRKLTAKEINDVMDMLGSYIAHKGIYRALNKLGILKD